MKLRLLERAIKVVIDTNIIVSAAIAKESNPAKVFELLLLEVIDNYTTDKIIDEIANVLNRPKIKTILNAADRQFVINKFKELSKNIKPVVKLNIIKEDPNDNKFLECALAAKADYIISGDSHLRNLKKFKEIRILSPKEFLDKYGFGSKHTGSSID